MREWIFSASEWGAVVEGEAGFRPGSGFTLHGSWTGRSTTIRGKRQSSGRYVVISRWRFCFPRIVVPLGGVTQVAPSGNLLLPRAVVI
ncbi:MAG: hypothetical protein ACM32O_08040 [Clostridia bacterium]